jgi:hypothetical protein
MRSCTPSAILADVSVQCLLSCDPLLNRLNAVADLVKLFEDAFKQQPDNDEFGRQAFFANVRAGNWKAAQLVRFSRHVAHRAWQQLYANHSDALSPCRSTLKLIYLS